VKLVYPKHYIVHIGKVIGGPTCCPIHKTNETFLLRILVEIGVMPSVGEVRRNRADLIEDVTCHQRIVIGPRVIDIFFGEKEAD
jgi:hypothetical protein